MKAALSMKKHVNLEFRNRREIWQSGRWRFEYLMWNLSLAVETQWRSEWALALAWDIWTDRALQLNVEEVTAPNVLICGFS